MSDQDNYVYGGDEIKPTKNHLLWAKFQHAPGKSCGARRRFDRREGALWIYVCGWCGKVLIYHQEMEEYTGG